MNHSRIMELMTVSIRALDAVEAQRADASLDERLDASIHALNTGVAFLRAVARDPASVDEDVSREMRQEAIRELLALRENKREMLSDSMDVMIDVVLVDQQNLAPGTTKADREYCRALLLDNDFLTEGELTKYPRESLYAIVRQRLKKWEATGGWRG